MRTIQLLALPECFVGRMFVTSDLECRMRVHILKVHLNITL